MEVNLKLGLVYLKSYIFWDIDYIVKNKKKFSKINLILIEITNFNIKSIPKNLDCITKSLTEIDVLEDILEQNPNVTWIHTISSGVDKFLKIPKILDNKITLTNSRGAYKTPLAEYSILGMLYFSYDIPTYNKTFNKRGWINLKHKLL